MGLSSPIILALLGHAVEFDVPSYAVRRPISWLLFGLPQNPDPWYSAFHYSHPPLVERLQAMRANVHAKKRD